MRTKGLIMEKKSTDKKKMVITKTKDIDHRKRFGDLYFDDLHIDDFYFDDN